MTGAAGGIGAAMARILAKDGINLFLVDLSEKTLNDTKKSISDQYPDIQIYVCCKDLCREESANELFQAVKKKEINLEILINNAGFGTLGFFSDTEWKREKGMIRLHIETVTHLTKLFLPEMLSKGTGKIMNVASVAGFLPSPLMAVYNASKAYVLSFSQAVANEIQDSGVTITVLCPGLTRTGFQKGVGVGNPGFTQNNFFSDSAENVARLAIKKMFQGKVIVVPGVLNNLLLFIQRFLPRNEITRLVRRIQEKNRHFLSTTGRNKNE